MVPDSSNRMSLTSPIFWLSAPSTSVPLNLVASHWSGFCELTKSALPALLSARGRSCDAAVALELDLEGELGACASAVDAISAPMATPINSFLLMERLLVGTEFCRAGRRPAL